MIKHYSTTKVCSYQYAKNCHLSLEPGTSEIIFPSDEQWQSLVETELTKIMEESRNEEELRHVWTEWHNKSGGPIKQLYKEFVKLSNQAAKINSK